MSTKSIKIGLYLLKRTETPYPDEWGACVVAAATEQEAREIANHESKAEGYLWTDGGRVSASYLGDAADDVSGIVLITKDSHDES